MFEKKENGQVYVWGKNNNGQLGLGDKENRNSPQLLESIKGEKIISIYGGFYHQLLLTGKIYNIYFKFLFYIFYFL